MSARLRIPVRVRLVGAVPGDPLTPQRVREAVFRAVAAGCEAAPLAALGANGPQDVALTAPTVVAPPGHEDVLTPTVLAALLDGARAGALETVRARLHDRPVAGGRVTGTPAEPFDPSRVRRRGGLTTYVVPFFDGGETEVPLTEEATATAAAAGPPPPLPAAGQVLTLVQALSVAWLWHVYRHGPRWDPGALGYPGFYGPVHVGGASRMTLVWITEVRGPVPEDGSLAARSYDHLWWPMLTLVPERGASRGIQRSRLDPSFGGYELTDTGETATVATVVTRIEGMVDRGGYPADFALRDPARRRAYAEALLRDHRGELVETQLIWNLAGGSQESLVVMPPTIGGTAVHGPIRFVTGTPTRTANGEQAGDAGSGGTGSGTGTGTGSGRGDGTGTATGTGGQGGTGGTGAQAVSPPPRGGRLGDSEHGRRLWPSTGVDGRRFDDGPYLAEPRSDLLVNDHGLIAKMRAIAAALEVPECPYLGRFALNTALMVAGRARGIGLGAVRATSMTEVTIRTDGGGNNGFLDVRPGASPEFDYLRLLARIAADVSDFGSAVINCYLDARNAGLVRVDPDWEPNAASWALRFSGDFNDSMKHGFTHLYAETCRALLLQQLRSSRQGIVGRKDHRFDQTLASFSSALDILGETVVQLTTLRRAIRYSEQVIATGTVREVMSVPREIGSRHERYTLPPPIQSIPAGILSVVGEARIERRGSQRVAVFQGRDWSVTDLEASIGTRRGLLNQVDPLFLQVSDLDALYAGAQRDAAHVRRYLTDLLGEMFRANTEMIAKSSDAEDGAFFALEASQYVEREGGRDWRGLRFELHGIHALADDQLRPHIGDDRHYVEGINAAIGRKADFDSFITIFSTIGIIALGLLCAPLGAIAAAAITGIAGLALTAVDVLEADRKTDLYRSLEDPELFLRWQEVQLAQLMAGLSIAFSVFDVTGVGKAAHAIVGTARQGLRVAERAGVGMAVRSVARSTRRELVRNMTREVLDQAVRQAVTEAAVVAVMTALLPRVITPVLVPWMRQQALEHGTLREVDAALGPLAAGLPTPTLPGGGH
ncbi:hypothetical protein [Micromonospora sp. NPDC049679]|uniref:hypothetical protein n=1 Tax=Micromonospora sp. NPDC049679 TaxID=3155920 RepID=UPI0033E4D44C